MSSEISVGRGTEFCLTNARHHFNGRFGGIFKESFVLRSMLSAARSAHFSRGAKNKRAFNESLFSLAAVANTQFLIAASGRAAASVARGSALGFRGVASCDSRNLTPVSRGAPRTRRELFVTSDSFSENNKRIRCNSIGHVLAEIWDDFVSCGGGDDLVLLSAFLKLAAAAAAAKRPKSDNRWNNLRRVDLAQ